MSTEIYFFSGTGNSLHVAKELGRRLPDSRLIPIVGLLHKDGIKAGADMVGLVFPVHALTIPLAVKRFLRKIDLSSAEYVFAAATRMGLRFNGFATLDKMLRRGGNNLDAGFILNMASNDVKDIHYRTPAESEITRLEAAVQEDLEAMGTLIWKRERRREKDAGYLIDVNPWHERLVVSLMNLSEHVGGVNYYCCDSVRTGCGLCEKVCLSQKIKMNGAMPVWQKEVLCYMCYACVNYCPRQAVQINDIPYVKSYTRQNGRYFHPYATAVEIARRKDVADL